MVDMAPLALLISSSISACCSSACAITNAEFMTGCDSGLRTDFAAGSVMG